MMNDKCFISRAWRVAFTDSVEEQHWRRESDAESVALQDPMAEPENG